ncbi:hypothetical protein Btru_023838 [Bulinus truncatus]|nr:hypothetical protein Btru_023838 [Bulinus truncatus]
MLAIGAFVLAVMFVFHIRSDEADNLTTVGSETGTAQSILLPANEIVNTSTDAPEDINSETTMATNDIQQTGPSTVDTDADTVPATTANDVTTDVLSITASTEMDKDVVTVQDDTDQGTITAAEAEVVTKPQPPPTKKVDPKKTTPMIITAKKTPKVTPATNAPEIPDQVTEMNKTDTDEGSVLVFDNQTTQEKGDILLSTQEAPESVTGDTGLTEPNEVEPLPPQPPRPPQKVPECARPSVWPLESEKDSDDCSGKGGQRFLLLLNGVERDITESACVVPVYAKTTDVNLKLCVIQSRVQYSIELSGDDMHYTFVPKRDFCVAFTFSLNDIKTMKFVKITYNEMEDCLRTIERQCVLNRIDW